MHEKILWALGAALLLAGCSDPGAVNAYQSSLTAPCEVQARFIANDAAGERLNMTHNVPFDITHPKAELDDLVIWFTENKSFAGSPAHVTVAKPTLSGHPYVAYLWEQGGRVTCGRVTVDWSNLSPVLVADYRLEGDVVRILADVSDGNGDPIEIRYYVDGVAHTDQFLPYEPGMTVRVTASDGFDVAEATLVVP